MFKPQLIDQLRGQLRLFVKIYTHPEKLFCVYLFLFKKWQKDKRKRKDKKWGYKGVDQTKDLFFALLFLKGSVFDLIGLIGVGIPFKVTDIYALNEI